MHAPPEYSEPYADQGVGLANFFGMIANIDDNVGQLRAFLAAEGLAENTIFIFTTDNGSSAGWRLFNAGMRAGKGSEYDGGHRVPFFVHWPAGDLQEGRDVRPITAHVDVVPSLLELCQIPAPDAIRFDGTSIVPLLRETATDWPDRILVTDSQRVKDPIKWRKSAVMTSQWRLINGEQLFDIQQDPNQQFDVAGDYPQVVTRLRNFYDAWWQELLPTFAHATAIDLGHPADNPARLTSHDWITTRLTPWNQRHIRTAMNGAENIGFWNVDVVAAGDYEIRLRRWPKSVDAAIDAGLPAGPDVPGQQAYRAVPGKAIRPVTAHLQIGDIVAAQAIPAGAKEITFRVQLPAGKQRLTTTWKTADGEVYGAYYAYVEKR
jgi:arylsulfatase B